MLVFLQEYLAFQIRLYPYLSLDPFAHPLFPISIRPHIIEKFLQSLRALHPNNTRRLKTLQLRKLSSSVIEIKSANVK